MNGDMFTLLLYFIFIIVGKSVFLFTFKNTFTALKAIGGQKQVSHLPLTDIKKTENGIFYRKST